MTTLTATTPAAPAPPLDAPTLATLVQAVQANCHVADARHAGDLTLCTYLLQMREFFRWERALPFGAALAHADVGAWIAEREALWDGLDGRAPGPLPLPGGAQADPFEVERINAALAPSGLLYGAGLVGADRPVFFLAARHAETRRDGLPVQVAGRELARGLLAPVAALAEAAATPAIVLRRESLARWCWERFEAFRHRPSDVSPFHAVVQAYRLDEDFAAALPRWLDEQGEAAILHELGEAAVGRRLGPAWATLRQALPTRRGALYAAAVRDLLADLQVTLPTLLDRGADASVHVWFAQFDGVRALLAPALPPAYAAWRAGDGGALLRRRAAAGQTHFMRLAEAALARLAEGDEDAGAAIEQLLQSPDAVWSP